MLYALTLAVCSVLHGGCHAEVLPVSLPERPLPFDMIAGPQIEMAKWVSNHPEYTIVKWALTPMSRVAKNS